MEKFNVLQDLLRDTPENLELLVELYKHDAMNYSFKFRVDEGGRTIMLCDNTQVLLQKLKSEFGSRWVDRYVVNRWVEYL
jgi:hypothetical protein